MGSLSLQSGFAAGLLCHVRHCPCVPAVPVLAEAQSSLPCSSAVTWGSVRRALGCAEAAGDSPAGPGARRVQPCSGCVCGVLHSSSALQSHIHILQSLLMPFWLSAHPSWLPAKTSCLSFLSAVGLSAWMDCVSSSINFCAWQSLEIMVAYDFLMC